MKKFIFTMIFIAIATFTFAGISYSWQGRMEGMGNPYGLIQDESDFLIHPALINRSKEINIYSHYDFTYTDVTDWDVGLDYSGDDNDSLRFDASGDSHTHDALLGCTFPAGPGTLGAFFSFDAFRGEYDGYDHRVAGSDSEFQMDSDKNDYSVAFMYGLPIKSWDTGFELGLSHTSEEIKTQLDYVGSTISTQNYIWSFNQPHRSLFPYMIPLDSEYWTINGKVGAAKTFNSIEIATTLRGGYILRSEHDYRYKYGSSRDTKMEGDVDGFNIGNETWLRVGLSDCLVMPLLFSVDYSETRRKGYGSDAIGTPIGYDYKHKTTDIDIKTGAGLDWEWCNNTRFGAGLYYNYLQIEEDVTFRRDTGSYRKNDKMPLHKEHRLLINLTAEKGFSPDISISTGVGFFYGFVNENFAYINYTDSYEDDISLDGDAWGIDISLGASIKSNQLTIEPFINGGYRQFDLDGDGNRTGSESLNYDMDIEREEWYVGGGFSLLFGN